jgi:hypothetical protein
MKWWVTAFALLSLKAAVASEDPVWLQNSRGTAGFPEAAGYLTPVGAHMDCQSLVAVRVGAGGYVCVATEATVLERPRVGAAFYVTAGKRPAARIRALALDAHGKRWVATAAGISGPSGKLWLSGEDTNSLAVDPRGDIWVGSPGFITRIKGDETGMPLRLSIPAGEISDLAVDSTGVVHALLTSGELLHGGAGGFATDRFPRQRTGSMDWGGLAPYRNDLVVGRWLRDPSGYKPLPIRDHNTFIAGLKCPQVFGMRPSKNGWLTWYGAAATGLTAYDGINWVEHLASAHVRDADMDETGAIWAATDIGLYCVSGGDEKLVSLPDFVPGSALDGILSHDGKVVIWGGRGLFTTNKPAEIENEAAWTQISMPPVLDALHTKMGLGYLRPGKLVFGAAGVPLANNLPPGILRFAFTDPTHAYLATADGLFSYTSGQRGALMECGTQGMPLALAATNDQVALATAEPRPMLWAGQRLRTKAGPTLKMEPIPVAARCLLPEHERILVGTEEGLASLEANQLHWFYREPKLRVDKICWLGSFCLLATNRGLLLLEGPTVVAENPLGVSGGPDRVTGLLQVGQEIWVTTAGLGLVRFRWQPALPGRHP